MENELDDWQELDETDFDDEELWEDDAIEL